MKVQSRELISKRLIGKGSSSIVYETTWKGESYARKDFLDVPSDIFESEAAVLVGLDDHPNVLRAYCWTVDEESCSLVIQLMDDDLLNMMQRRKASQRKKLNSNSESIPSDASQTISYVIDLAKFIEDRKKVSVATSKSVASRLVQPAFDMTEALHIIVQLAEGMKFLHDNIVVHGDLKPKNVLVTPRERVVSGSPDQYVKVADFGLVGTKMTSRTLVSCQTRNLEMLRWRAPELLDCSSLTSKNESFWDSDWDSDSDSSFGKINVRDDNLTFAMLARADVYNFAITCSQILTGEDPYLGLGLNELVREIPLGLRPGLPHGCPAQLSDLLERCWGEDIIGRPNFHDILSELKALQASPMADIPVDIKETTAGPSSERAEGPPQLVSDRSSGSSNSLPQIGVDKNEDAPVGHEKHINMDIQDSFKGTDIPKRRRRRRKVFTTCFGCTWGAKLNIYISYSGASKYFSFILSQKLKAKPYYKVFIDSDLLMGVDFGKQIMQELENTDLAIVVVTEEFFHGKYPMREMEFFMDGCKEGKVRVLPLFYKLTPAKIRDDLRRGRWEEDWKSMSTERHPIDVASYRRAVETLCKLNGVVYRYPTVEHIDVYIDEILKAVNQIFHERC